MGPDPHDDKEVVNLGRVIRWTTEGVEFEADPRHRRVLLEHFGFDDSSSAAANNGDKSRREDDGEEEEEMGAKEAK